MVQPINRNKGQNQYDPEQDRTMNIDYRYNKNPNPTNSEKNVPTPPTTPPKQKAEAQSKSIDSKDVKNNTNSTTGILASTGAIFTSVIKTAASALKTASLYTSSAFGGSLIVGSTIQTIQMVKADPTRKGMKNALPQIAGIGAGILLTGIAQLAGSDSQKRALAITAGVAGAVSGAVMIFGQIALVRNPSLLDFSKRTEKKDLTAKVVEELKAEPAINEVAIAAE